MRGIRGITAARIGGGLLGGALAVGLLITSQPGGAETVGAEVSFSAAQTGELLLEPPGPEPFLSATVKPGESTDTATLRVTNQTGGRIAATPRVLPSIHTLDPSLVVSLAADGRPLASAPLARLRARPLTLGPGGSAQLTVSAALAPTARPGWEAQLVDLAIVFDLGR